MDMLTLITSNKISYDPITEHFDISCLKIDVKEGDSDKREFTCVISNFVTYPFHELFYDYYFKKFKHFKYLLEIYMHHTIEDEEVEKEL